MRSEFVKLDKSEMRGRLEAMKVPTIYCDMDQVLVNFLAGAKRVLGKEFNDPSLGPDRDKWLYLSTVPGFWTDLEWMPGAKALWDRIKSYDTYILSAIPPADENPPCSSEKKLWCQRELVINTNRVLTVRRSEKSTYAVSADGSPNLLIDDHPRNVTDWLNAGGIAILHHTVPETLVELTNLGL